MNSNALKDLLYRMADDSLIIAHRHSEWTGMGPLLEEDIAFSSIAQDKLGHALALYSLLHDVGEQEPDTTAFTRNERDFHCCQFVELPNGEYDFSLVRHFLFDASEKIRYDMLQHSSYEPLAKLARKMRGEIKYHIYHGQTWLVQLGGQGSEESKARMQSALDEAMPYALGLFETTELENEIISSGLFEGEMALKDRWVAYVTEVVNAASLRMPDVSALEPVVGGRKGFHTADLQPLLDEMTEVFRLDPSAEW